MRGGPGGAVGSRRSIRLHAHLTPLRFRGKVARPELSGRRSGGFVERLGDRAGARSSVRAVRPLPVRPAGAPRVSALAALAALVALTLLACPLVGAHAPSPQGSPPAFDVRIAASPNSGSSPLSVSFDAAESGGAAPVNFSWSFGDGATSQVRNASHVFSSVGVFEVELRAKDALGEVATCYVNISVNPATSNAPFWASWALPGLSFGETVILVTIGLALLLLVRPVLRLSRLEALAEGSDTKSRRRGGASGDGDDHGGPSGGPGEGTRPERPLPLAFLPFDPPPSSSRATGLPPATGPAGETPQVTLSPAPSGSESPAEAGAAFPRTLGRSSHTYVADNLRESPEGVVWLRSSDGEWERVGSVPSERVGEDWVRKYRRVNGLGSQTWLSILPPDAVPKMLAERQPAVELLPPGWGEAREERRRAVLRGKGRI